MRTTSAQQGTLIPPETPVFRRVDLVVRIDLSEPNWWLNRVLVDRVLDSLADPQGVLTWLNDDLPESSLTPTEVAARGRRVFHGRVNLASHDLPEDPNAWGHAQQAIVLTFQYEDPEIDTSVFDATFTPSVGPALDLGRVTEFQFAYNATRYSPLRDQRSRAGGVVTLRGYWSPRVPQNGGSEPEGLGSILPSRDEL